ncbi:MAG: PrgI family protein [bacterium]|nr:PrgI family protein [bacterium]
MEQHPIPRQITSFEFKLIGFMTLKQFLYLAVSCPVGYIVFYVVSVPMLNVILGILVASIGAVFAFVTIQDRPIGKWIGNFLKRLNSPTQYTFKKKNHSIKVVENLYFTEDPHVALAHVETKEMLNAYMNNKKQNEREKLNISSDTAKSKQKIHVDDLLKQTQNTQPQTIQKVSDDDLNLQSIDPDALKQPFITGIIKNRKNIALPGILVSIQNNAKEQLRLLKTNPHGIFATYSKLPAGDYVFKVSDPNDNYFFDTMNLHIDPDNVQPLMIYSKEIL